MKITTLTSLFILFASAIYAGPATKFAYHTVEKGETLYSISRQYGIKPAELASYNEAIGDKLTIKIGQKLKVPSTAAAENENNTPEPMPVAIKSAPKAVAAAPTPSSSGDDYHIVAKGETFYSISRAYHVERTDLQMWNDLDDMNIKVGQKLLIKKDNSSAQANVSKEEIEKAIKKDGYTYQIPKVTEPNVSTATGDATASSSAVGLASTKTVKSWKTESATERMENYKPKTGYDPANEYESLYYQNVYSGLSKKTETGTVKLITDNNTAQIAYYNNASVGSILKLTNPDNGKTTYAIVVGKIPPAENNSYLVKLSDRVGRNLSVKDYNSVEVVCYTGN